MPRPRLRPGHPYLAGAPILCAHRGGARLAPENTLEAFRHAVERWGADMLEMDVHRSRDGRIVVIHDPTVDRTTDGSGRVSGMDWTEIRELDAGHAFRDLDGEPSHRGRGVRVPSLDEVLEAFPRTRLNVEVKAADAAAGTAELVRCHGATGRVLLAAEHERNRAGARGYPGPWGASRRQLLSFWILHRTPLSFLYTPDADALQVPERWKGRPVVDRRFVREAHARNLPVHVWTVDDPDAMRRLLKLGVDAIQSDRPDLLARVLVERGARPPPPGLESAGDPP